MHAETRKDKEEKFWKRQRLKCIFEKKKGFKCKILKRMGLTGKSFENKRGQKAILQKTGLRMLS